MFGYRHDETLPLYSRHMEETLNTEKSKFQHVARGAELLMGLVFLVAGAVKVWEPALFYWEAVPYTYVLELGDDLAPVAGRIALLLGPFEMCIGLALMLHWLPKVTLPIATALMAFFFALVVAAWDRGYGGNCGCFGAILERGAGEAVVEDSLMLLLLILATIGTWRIKGKFSGKWVLGIMLLSLAISGIRYWPDRNRLEDSDLQVGVQLWLSARDGSVNLGEGDFLIAVFNPECSHCQRAVPQLNRLFHQTDIPSVVGLTHYPLDSEAIKQFTKEFKPEFQLASISGKDFTRLAWGHEYPRFAYIRDGVILAVWEAQALPGVDQLAELKSQKF